MKASYAALYALTASAAIAQTPETITVSVHNETGVAANGIQVRAEAFGFDIPSLEPGATITRTVRRNGGNCGVAVSFSSVGATHRTGAELLVPDKSHVATIHLRIASVTTLRVTTEPAQRK